MYKLILIHGEFILSFKNASGEIYLTKFFTIGL